MSTATDFAEGWYLLPDRTQERYWNGSAWTGAFRPVGLSGTALRSARYHGLAIASMVLGIVSLVVWYFGILTGVLGLVFGAMSLKHCAPRGQKRGRGMAIAGISCSIVALAIWAMFIVFAVAASSNP